MRLCHFEILWAAAPPSPVPLSAKLNRSSVRVLQGQSALKQNPRWHRNHRVGLPDSLATLSHVASCVNVQASSSRSFLAHVS